MISNPLIKSAVAVALVLLLAKPSIGQPTNPLAVAEIDRVHNSFVLVKRAYHRQQQASKLFWDGVVETESARIMGILTGIAPETPLPEWSVALPLTIQPTDYAALLPAFGFQPRVSVAKGESWAAAQTSSNGYSVCLTHTVKNPAELAIAKSAAGRLNAKGRAVVLYTAGCVDPFAEPLTYPHTLGFFETLQGYSAPQVPVDVLNAIEAERQRRLVPN